jgi:histidyl-tRNA synthetase
VQVYVAAAGGDLTEERMQLCNKFWKAGINAEMSQKAKLKPLDQFGHCEKNSILWAVVLGPDELAQGKAKIRNIVSRTEDTVELGNILEEIKGRLDNDNVTDSFVQLSL